MKLNIARTFHRIKRTKQLITCQLGMHLNTLVLITSIMCLYTESASTLDPYRVRSHVSDFAEAKFARGYKTQRGQRGGRVRHIKTIITNRSQCDTETSDQARNTNNLITFTDSKHDLQHSVFGTVNARSARKNLNAIKYTVDKTRMDILAVTETWFNVNDDYESRKICPQGYKLVRKDRENKKGGGVAFLLGDGYNATVLPTEHFASFEHLAISVTSGSNSARFVVIYRPPAQSLVSFIENFTKFLEDTALGGAPIVFAGDFNLHWDTPNDTYVRKFKEICDAFGLLQHVESPTHVKGHTLDLILGRSSDNLVLNNTRIGDMISDHFFVACDLFFDKPMNKRRSITYRKIRKIDIPAFRSDILALPLSLNYKNTDLIELCDAYDSQLRTLLDKHKPEITRTASTKRRDPWDTTEVLDAVRVKRRSERRYRKTRSDNDYELFCKKRDIFNKTLEISKTNYLSHVIEENSRDPKSLFSHMNAIMHKVKDNPLPQHSSAKSLANDFNAFFKDQVEKIRQTSMKISPQHLKMTSHSQAQLWIIFNL